MGEIMDALWLVFLLVINLGISIWNAKVCGESWVESKAIGGPIRLIIWCAAIQSAIGFSMIIMVIILFAGQSYFPPEIIKFMSSLWYLVIIIPALSTGFIIMIYSWVAAFRDRSLTNMGTAAWNTFAMAHNTYNAVSGIGDVWENVTDILSGDGDNKLVMLAILLVIIALFGGALITSMIIKHYAGTLSIPVRRENYESSYSR
jgi:hypothetical protein